MQFEKIGKTLIVKFDGELDHHSANRIRDEIDCKFEQTLVKNLVLDMKGLTFMDSSGIGVIIGRYKKIRAVGGVISIANVNPSLKKIIDVSGITKILNIFHSTEEALRGIV